MTPPPRSGAPAGDGVHRALDLAAAGWVDVCAFDALTPDRGVRALVGGRAVAVFRCSPGDELHAVGDIDPTNGASVMARGLVGDTEVDGRAVLFVASPLRKQRYRLIDGEGLADPSLGLGVWPVRCVDGQVQVATRPVVEPRHRSR